MNSNRRGSLQPVKRSQTPKAIREANRRKKEYEAKRFNEPLRIFLERKHPEILTKFNELYNYLDFVNPSKKNLCKSAEFKEWMTENPLPTSTEQNIPVIPLPPASFDIVGAIFKEVVGEKEPSSEAANTQDVEPGADIVGDTSKDYNMLTGAENPLPTPSEQDTPLPTVNSSIEADIAGEILEELFGDTGPLSETVNCTRDAETEDVMSEYYRLMRATDVPIHNADEGIELNHYDELAYDLEPFDFDDELAHDLEPFDFNMI